MGARTVAATSRGSRAVRGSPRRNLDSWSCRFVGTNLAKRVEAAGTIAALEAFSDIATRSKENGMPKDAHNKAAEHHENAAKSHRTAAEHHGKGEHAKGREESTRAHGHSKTAHEHSEMAHGKSQSQK
jgi:hypothetical protein